jgi:hypothetical protein
VDVRDDYCASPHQKSAAATQKLFLEVSSVGNRRLPHIWVAEFTSQVECRPMTVRKKMPHKRYCHPKPMTSSHVVGSVGSRAEADDVQYQGGRREREP